MIFVTEEALETKTSDKNLMKMSDFKFLAGITQLGQSHFTIREFIQGKILLDSISLFLIQKDN